MNGILCVDKPPDFTSFDVVAKLRGMLKTKKIGHGGTLDPMATGVLPIFVGRATKACDMLPVQDKRYTAMLRLGLTTDTQDATGAILSQSVPQCGRAEVEQALAAYTGPQQQLPPMYSAIKVNGRRLYDLARKGIEVERPPRSITVHHIALLEALDRERYRLDIACSKGTYIRTLCHDIGQRLGCGGIMESLRRTEACGYTIEQCLTLEELQALADEGAVEDRLLPIDSAFAAYPRLDLEEKQARLFSNGVRLSPARLGYGGEEQSLRVYDHAGNFLAIAKTERETDTLRMAKWFGGRYSQST